MQAAAIELEQSCSQLRGAFDAIEDAVIVLDLDYNIVLANRSCENTPLVEEPMTGMLQEAVIGEKCYRVLHGRTSPCDECPCETVLATGEPCRRVSSHELADGTTGWYETSYRRIDDQDGNAIGVIEHGRDITVRERALQQLRSENTHTRLLVSQSRDGIVVLDQQGSIYEANEAFAKMLGYTLEEVYQLSVFDWERTFPREAVLEMVSWVDNKSDTFETRHMRKDGSFIDVEISTNGTMHDGKKLIFSVCRDVTERNASARLLEELARKDTLTETYNRRYMFERLSEMVAEHSREGTYFCISLLDIDHFKSVNDTYGHQAGDYVLKEFARLVSSLIRPYDFLGRYGGEEFLIMSKNTRAAATYAIIERIMGAIRETPFVFNGQTIQLTFSCGLMENAEFPRDRLSIDEAVALADERLYKAKACGRDRIVGPIVGIPLRIPTLAARK